MKVKLSYEEKENNDLVSPTFVAARNLDYVQYSDVNIKNSKYKNKYPDHLLFLRQNEGWHGTIMLFKDDQVAGKGFTVENEDQKTLDFLENINDNEDANEILSKVAFDFNTFGGFSLLVTFSNDWKKIARVDHVSFDKIRSGKVNAKGIIDKYYYCYDWGTQRQPKQLIPAFSTTVAKTKAKAYKEALQGTDEDVIKALNIESRTQIVYFKNYTTSNFYYPLPDYVHILSAIRTDMESDLYSETLLKNGMRRTTHVNLVGTYTEEQFEEEANVILDNYTGASKTGLPFITKSTTPEGKPQLSQVGDDAKEDRFKVVNEVTRQKIVSGHRLTSPLLAGIALAGTLGNRDELLNAYELFYTNVIQPKQFKIAKVFNKILKINGMAKVEIERLVPFDLEDNNNDIDNNTEPTKSE